MNKCVVVQGPSNNVADIKRCFSGYGIIFSTWYGEESKYLPGDICVFNEPPEDPGYANFWYQQKSTLSGLLKAKELGYTHVLKFRSDMITTDGDIFDLFDNNKLNFLCWHYHEVYPNCKGYLIDYFMYGSVDDMLRLWSIDNMFCKVPEIIITNSFIKNNNHVPNFILFNLVDGYDIYWIKRNVWLSSYRNTLYPDKYKKYDFGETFDYLTDDYLNGISF